MAQEIINTGATANDGTGDPLRTAFIKTDSNFDQIWAAGPVGTNVQISGNTITTLQVNQDLVLAPNGVANVRLNNNTVPNANNIWYLGSTTNRWRGVYVGAAGLDVTGNISAAYVTVTEDLTVNGNLIVEGDVIQIGNIVTDAKTIQLANTAATDAQANGSGITVGANDDVATLLYNSTNNEWRTNIGANVSGNVTANYFIGNGSQLTGIVSTYGNANVAAYLPTYTGNLTGNSASLTNTLILGNLELYSDATGATDALIKTAGGSGADINIESSGNLYLTPDGGEVLITKQTASVDENTGALLVYGGIGVNGNVNSGGNISANYFIGNGSLLTGVSSYANANVLSLGETGWAGNIIPVTSNTYSLGNATNQWSDLYVSNATIYMNNVPIGLTAGNVLTVDGEPVLVNDSNTSITTTGNITADTFFGSGVTAAAANDVVALNAFDTDGNTVSIQAQGNTASAVIETYFQGANNRFTWSFDNSGTLTFPASQTSIFGGYDNDLTINTSNLDVGTTYTFTFSQFGDLSVPVNLYVSGNVYTNDIVADAGNVTVTANTQSWLFDDNGTLTLPGNSQILPAGNTGVRFSADASDITGLFLNNAGDAELYANANVSIYADSANSGQGWTFDTTGNLTLPNNGSIIVDDDGVIGPDGDDMVISWDNEELILRSVEGSVELQADNDVSITTSYGAGDFQWIFGNNNELVNITGDSAIVTEAGNLAISGGRDGLSSGNVTVRAVDVGVAVRDWTFDNNGDLTVPNYIYFKDGTFIGDEGGALPPVFRVDAPLGLGIDLTTDSDITGNNYTWSFGIDGNLTLPVDTFAVKYANGTAVSLGGNYGDANVVTLLGSFGSNTVVTTGNITGGNLIATANVLANGYARLTGGFDESQASTAGLYLGYAGGTPRMMFGTGNTSQTLEIDNDGGTLRFYKPGTTLASLTNTGVFTATGNVSAANVLATTSHRWSTGNATISLSTGSISLTPDTSLSGTAGIIIGGSGYLLAPNGSRNAVLNYGGGSGTMGIYTVNIYGNQATAITNGGSNGVGNIGANSSNRFNTVFATAGDFSGNVTAANFVGNISLIGNVTGTSPNVTLVAGSYSYVFDNTGILTLPTGSSGNEGGEIAFTQAANSTLAGDTVIIDQYVDRVRFFESGGNTRGMYIDLATSPDGVGAAIGYRDIPQISFSANATAALADAGKHYYSTTAGNLVLTLPDNSNVAFATGTALTIVVNAAGNVLVNQGTGVSLYQAGSSTTGNRVVGAYGMATVMKVAANTWVINGTGVY